MHVTGSGVRWNDSVPSRLVPDPMGDRFAPAARAAPSRRRFQPPDARRRFVPSWLEATIVAAPKVAAEA